MPSIGISASTDAALDFSFSISIIGYKIFQTTKLQLFPDPEVDSKKNLYTLIILNLARLRYRYRWFPSPPSRQQKTPSREGMGLCPSGKFTKTY